MANRDSSYLHLSYPANKLKWGHAYGNQNVFVTLDGKSDVMNEASSVRRGLRESTNQRYYMLGWEINLFGSKDEVFTPEMTTFSPVFQQTTLKNADTILRKVNID